MCLVIAESDANSDPDAHDHGSALWEARKLIVAAASESAAMITSKHRQGGAGVEQVARALAMSVQEASNGDTSAAEGGWAVNQGHLVAVPLGPSSLRTRQWLRDVRLLRRSLAGNDGDWLRGNGIATTRTLMRSNVIGALQQHTMLAVQGALVSLAGGLHGANHDGAVYSSSDGLQEALCEEAALCLGELGDAPIASSGTKDDDGNSDDDNDYNEIDDGKNSRGSGKEGGPSTRRSDSIGRSNGRSTSTNSQLSIKTRALVMLCEALLDADPW